MKAKVHLIAGFLATLLVASFWSSTVVSELFLSRDAVVGVKRVILFGIGLLIPTLMVAGGTGFALSRSHKGKLVENKKWRMRLIGLNGALVLAPSAFFLDWRAARGQVDPSFFAVQGVELLAGAAQLVLLSLNVRDGLRMSGRLRTPGSSGSPLERACKPPK